MVWDQPACRTFAEFNTSIKKITGVAATARNWFGYASVQTLALIANQEKTLDAPKLARALCRIQAAAGDRVGKRVRRNTAPETMN